jgi:transposase
MTQPQIWIGIDVCQDWLDVHLRPAATHCRVAYTAAAIAELIQTWQCAPPTLVVVEATGGLERPIVQALQAAGMPIAVVNPRRVRDMAKASGKAKTDKLDAAVLAEFAEWRKPRPKPVTSQAAQDLLDLVRRRQQLVDTQVAEKNRLKRASDIVRPDIEAHLAELSARIEACSNTIDQLTLAQTDGPRKSAILRSVKGIGPRTTAICLAELPELGQVSDKQIACLVGVAPMNADSGKHRGKRVIQGGRTNLRCGLYMATFAATRWNPVIKPFYQRLMAKGKPHNVALIACMRKLLVIINAMIRDNQTWIDPA